MSNEELKKFKERLEAEKVTVENQIKEADMPPQFDDEPGPDDETDEAEEYFNKTSSLHGLKEKLSNIQSALIRIQKGTYGMCQSCSKPIDMKILEMVPESNLCQDCNKIKHK